VLIFMPGSFEIAQTLGLSGTQTVPRFVLLPLLHGELPPRIRMQPSHAMIGGR
jgi:hypothetical protein